MGKKISKTFTCNIVENIELANGKQNIEFIHQLQGTHVRPMVILKLFIVPVELNFFHIFVKLTLSTF